MAKSWSLAECSDQEDRLRGRARDHEAEPREEEAHRQRSDERVDSEVDDEHAVREADRDGEPKGDGHGEQHGLVVPFGENGKRDRGDGDRGPQREVDLRGDEREREGRGEDPADCGEPPDVHEVVGGEEVRRRQREVGEERDERNQRAVIDQ